MKRFIFFAISLSVSLSLFAQNKLFNLEDLSKTRELYAENLSQLQWIPNTYDFVYVKNNLLVKGTLHQKEVDSFVTLNELNDALINAGLSSLKSFPYILHWTSEHGFYFRWQEKLLHYAIDKKNIDKQISINKEAENIEIDFKHAQLAYTIQNNLYVVEENASPFQINPTAPEDVKFGHIVHRNEFGIENGSFWSPNGNYLAFYRMDESMVADYPLVNTSTPMATLKNEKYPMAGETSHEVSLGVYNMQTKQIVYIQTGEPKDQYLCCISWSPDENYIFIAVLNREQNHLKLNQYDAKTGQYIKTMFEEKNERYVEPSHPLYFLPNHPNQFLWLSRRDGWNHFYLYDLSGKLLKQLTKGNWEVKDFAGFDPAGNNMFFYSNKDEITGNHFYTLNLKNQKITRITNESGTHRIMASYDGTYFLDIYNSIDIANEIKIKDRKGEEKALLLKNKNHLSNYALPETRLFTIKNPNKNDLYCRMILPSGFDSNKTYPVFIYVYGGPHSQMVTNTWLSGGWFLHYMAQKGYIVFTLDNRGTNNRGFEFESCIHRRLGDLEVEDQMCGVDYLKSLPYVDTARLSIDGWSYGGFMTLSIFLRHPGVFNRASCGGPVIDWKYYEVMYGERYMDTPQDNPEGYKKASLLNYVDSIQGKLLIFHGCMDPTVVWQNTLQFIDKSIKAQKLVDYFVYPSHGHNVGGIDRLHLWKKIENFHAY